jgi:hypothetical protein
MLSVSQFNYAGLYLFDELIKIKVKYVLYDVLIHITKIIVNRCVSKVNLWKKWYNIVVLKITSQYTIPRRHPGEMQHTLLTYFVENILVMK